VTLSVCYSLSLSYGYHRMNPLHIEHQAHEANQAPPPPPPPPPQNEIPMRNRIFTFISKDKFILAVFAFLSLTIATVVVTLLDKSYVQKSTYESGCQIQSSFLLSLQQIVTQCNPVSEAYSEANKDMYFGPMYSGDLNFSGLPVQPPYPAPNQEILQWTDADGIYKILSQMESLSLPISINSYATDLNSVYAVYSSLLNYEEVDKSLCPSGETTPSDCNLYTFYLYRLQNTANASSALSELCKSNTNQYVVDGVLSSFYARNTSCHTSNGNFPSACGVYLYQCHVNDIIKSFQCPQSSLYRLSVFYVGMGVVNTLASLVYSTVNYVIGDSDFLSTRIQAFLVQL
jgi:hypothetical protein